VILSPEEIAAASTAQLLEAAALCQIPVDHRLLRELIGRGDAILPDFTAFLQLDRVHDRIDLTGDLLRIARAMRTPAALPFLAALARADEFVFPDELIEAFVEIGAPAADTLLDLYSDSRGADDVRFALAGLRSGDPRVVEVLLKKLESDPVDAAIALGLNGDPSAIPALEGASAAADEAERREIDRAIEELRQPHPPEPPPPYDIWPDYPDEDTPLFPALNIEENIAFLGSPVARYRAEAAETLGTERMDERVRVRLLAVAREDSDTHVRATAWEALEGAGEDENVHHAMHERLNTADIPAEERAAIAVSLAHEASDHDEVHQLILDLYQEPATRAQAVKAMWHSLDRRFERYVPLHIDDQDVAIRTQALLAAGWFGMPNLLSRIEAAFEHDDLRTPALFAYGLAAPGDTSPARMRKLYRRISELAHGLTDHEAEVVERALNERLTACEYEPISIAHEGEEEDEPEPAPAAAPAQKAGRNDPCPCGSGKKFKKCCGR
jgi:hypothetical protein